MAAPTDKAAQRVLLSQRRFTLRLYKAILRSHQVRLSPDMRPLGDAYVREEFQLHKTAKAEHLRGFFEGWMDYLQMLHGTEDGRAMSPEQLNSLTAEQKKQLMKLENEISKLHAEPFQDMPPELQAQLDALEAAAAAADAASGEHHGGHEHHEGCGHSHGEPSAGRSHANEHIEGAPEAASRA